MSSRALPIALPVIGLIAVIVLAVMNGAAVPLNLFGASVSLPEGVLPAVGYVLGAALTFPLFFARSAREAESEKRLTEWEAQDKKLASQVQSDREKQLEAKVQTLEAALQRALKK